MEGTPAIDPSQSPSASLSPDDALLVRQARDGRLEAFEELVVRHERPIYSLALRILHNVHDAQDVTQQTFLSALEHLDSFREEARFATWIHRIATHAALKILRKQRGLETVSLDQALAPNETSGAIPHPEFIADWTQTPDELAHQSQTRRLIDDALAQLDEKHRLVFVLRDVEGFSVRETADALGLSEVNVRVRLLRARLQLRERLTRAFGNPDRAVRPGHAHHLV